MSQTHQTSRQLFALFDQLHTPNYVPHRLNIVGGKGSLVWNEDGCEYIDLAGGIAVSALGHCHPALVQAAEEAARGVWHLSNYWTNEPAMLLAQNLCRTTFAEKVFFGNSGAEANEAALKLARKFAHDKWGENKHKIVACDNSFHGRTLFTASVTGQGKYSRDFAPLPGGISHVPFNDCTALERELNESCCAFIVEPVQGEGGVIPISPEFALLARKLCDKHKILFIFDEIQTGMGRTGSLFAYQQLHITPDVLTSAKALGCGLPIGAMLTTKDIAASLSPGSHGTTSGGNPFVTHVANAALMEISTTELLAQVQVSNKLAIDRLAAINEHLGCFSSIRSAGLLIGCELAPTWESKGRDIVVAALEKGVMVLNAAGNSVIRLAPALNIPSELLEKGISCLGEALSSFQR